MEKTKRSKRVYFYKHFFLINLLSEQIYKLIEFLEKNIYSRLINKN